jgi:hypothetical protein
MNLAYNNFAPQFYRWAIADFRRELQQDFPLLQLLPEWQTGDLIHLFRSLDEIDRLKLSLALVKRVHPKGMEALGESLSPEEEKLIAKAEASCRARWEARRLKPSHEFVNYSPSSRRDVRIALSTALRESLTPILGSPNKGGPKGFVTFVTAIKSFRIETDCCFAPVESGRSRRSG